MAFTAATNEALSAPLLRDHVKQREQAGRKLSYIEGWHAIAEANRIFGFDGWTRETTETRAVSEKERQIGAAKKPGWGVSYVAKVRIRVGDVIRDGTGAGHGIDVDLGQAHESAIKEAETDATKRALMTFGNPFGLALYDKDQTNVVDATGDAAARYINESQIFIRQCELPHEIRIWWKSDEKARADLLTTKDQAALLNFCKARVAELERAS